MGHTYGPGIALYGWHPSKVAIVQDWPTPTSLQLQVLRKRGVATDPSKVAIVSISKKHPWMQSCNLEEETFKGENKNKLGVNL